MLMQNTQYTFHDDD